MVELVQPQSAERELRSPTGQYGNGLLCTKPGLTLQLLVLQTCNGMDLSAALARYVVRTTVLHVPFARAKGAWLCQRAESVRL